MIVRGLSDDDSRDLGFLLDQLDAKGSRNRLRAAAYDGKRAARDLGISMPPQMRRLSYVLGWAARPVDHLNLRCLLEGFNSPDASMDDLGLRRALDDNRFLAESQHGQLSALVHSVSFLVTTRGDEGEPEALFTFRDALNATGEWDARGRRLKSLLSVKEWGEDRKPSAGVLYLPGRTFDVSRDGGWVVTDARATSLDYVPAEPLVYKPRLGRPFGTSRITRPMLSLLDQALRTLGRSESQAEIFSLPQRYAMGADSTMFKDESGNDIPRWKILLGGVWWAENNEDGQAPQVGQFPQASQQPHLDHLRALGQQFAAESSMSPSLFGVGLDAANPSSAEAMEQADRPLIDLADGATREWGYAYARSMLTATRLLGTYSDSLRITPDWRDIRYTSRAAAADAGQKTLAAVPWLAETEVGLQLLGLTADQIERAMSEKRRAQARASILALTGDAVEG